MLLQELDYPLAAHAVVANHDNLTILWQFVQALPDSVRHVLVLLYFELLDGRMRDAAVLH